MPIRMNGTLFSNTMHILIKSVLADQTVYLKLNEFIKQLSLRLVEVVEKCLKKKRNTYNQTSRATYNVWDV